LLRFGILTLRGVQYVGLSSSITNPFQVTNSHTPTVRTVVESIRSRILDGTYRAGGSLPSEAELASAFQVGRGTIRKAIEILAESGHIERERHSRPIVTQPFNRAKDGDFTEVHVWVAQTIRDDTSVPFLQGISRGLSGTPFRMVVREPSFYVEDVVRSDEKHFLLDLIDSPKAAGAVIWRDVFADNAEAVARVAKKGIPLVFVDSPAPGNLPIDYVGTANSTSAKRCVERLIDLGHRRIVCIADSEIPPAASDRIKGYNRAMTQAGLSSNARCIIPPPGECNHHWNDRLGGVYARVLDKTSFYSDLAHEIVSEILSIDPLPTALFVTHDILACWVWAVLAGKGVLIPEQISIVGFDWRARWDRALADELDTAAQDFEGFGTHAIELLLDRITGESCVAARHILLDAPLIIRSSTSAAHLRMTSPLAAAQT